MSRRADALLRLCSAKERNALDAERQEGMAGRFRALEKRTAWTDRVAVSEGLFVTPAAIAARLAALCDLAPGMRVLEPSAGSGRLLDALADTGLDLDVTAAELCPRLCRELFEKYPSAHLRAGDFLAMDFPHKFDRVVMNPPFRRGTDCAHIKRALTLLRPGGVLVSLCYAGAQQARELRPLASHWERLPAGSFKSEGTAADVMLLRVDA